MSAPTIVWSETNGGGSSGQTQSIVQASTTDDIPSIQFASLDSPSTVAGLSANQQVAPGAYSFEKWLRWKVTSVAPDDITNFGFYFASAALADSAGAATITIKFGVTANYAPPVSTASTVATTDTATARGPAAAIAQAGPANALDAYSQDFLVLQAFVAAGAAQGSAQIPNAFISNFYSWS